MRSTLSKKRVATAKKTTTKPSGAEAREALVGLRADAKRSGADKMTLEEINGLIADTRQNAKTKKGSKAASRIE